MRRDVWEDVRDDVGDCGVDLVARDVAAEVAEDADVVLECVVSWSWTAARCLSVVWHMWSRRCLACCCCGVVVVVMDMVVVDGGAGGPNGLVAAAALGSAWLMLDIFLFDRIAAKMHFCEITDTSLINVKKIKEYNI